MLCILKKDNIDVGFVRYFYFECSSIGKLTKFYFYDKSDSLIFSIIGKAFYKSDLSIGDTDILDFIELLNWEDCYEEE